MQSGFKFSGISPLFVSVATRHHTTLVSFYLFLFRIKLLQYILKLSRNASRTPVKLVGRFCGIILQSSALFYEAFTLQCHTQSDLIACIRCIVAVILNLSNTEYLNLNVITQFIVYI